MKKEVELARHQADTVAAAAIKGGSDNETHCDSAAKLWRAESAENALHSAKLEAALTEAEQSLSLIHI